MTEYQKRLARHAEFTRKNYEPTMEQLQNRLVNDTKLLEKHPEHRDLLERRIERHKQHILAKSLGLPIT